MSFALNRIFRTSKVPPTIDGVFWVLKLLTTAMGEATSDFFVRRLNPELAVIGTGVVFLVVIWRQLRAPRYFITTYWAAVVMVSVFGTMCADVIHVKFGVPYAVSAAAFAVLLLAIFVTWSRSEHTLSIHSITTTRRELFYWATITVTFALGTAVGDTTATTLSLGYLTSGIVFAFVFCLPPLGYRIFRLNSIAMFWAAYILTRPLGASFADYMGKPKSVGGLGWGSGNVAMMFSAIIVAVVAGMVVRSQRGVMSRARHVARERYPSSD
ncbi:MAG: hypothetical protein WCA31_13090 [Acidimicrobiales bacterium]